MQVEKIEAPLVTAVEQEAEIKDKPADPAIEAAKTDVMTNAQSHASPERAASQETLAKLIAQTKNQ